MDIGSKVRVQNVLPVDQEELGLTDEEFKIFRTTVGTVIAQPAEEAEKVAAIRAEIEEGGLKLANNPGVYVQWPGIQGHCWFGSGIAQDMLVQVEE
jgi:hypothetical protein